MCWVFFLWYFTLQWPGRAASFESQGSCPSPKPPQTPWCSQVEWWHYLWKKPHVCCWEVALPNESFVSMLYEHSFWHVSYKFALKQFFFIHVNSSELECFTELTMHSTHCHSIQEFVFHTSALKFSEWLYLPDIYTDHMNGRPHSKKSSVIQSQLYQPHYLSHIFQAFLVS